MNRSYHRPAFCNDSSLKELRLKTAIHEAGHAAAIYLGNKQKQLPPVFFQIVISGLCNHPQFSNNQFVGAETSYAPEATAFKEANLGLHSASLSGTTNLPPVPPITHRYFAKVHGGRLIHTLPVSVAEAVRDFETAQKQAYLQAFEADIINLLVGPLAEANYVAMQDDEIINSCLVNLSALINYGGAADLQVVGDYLDCLTKDMAEREQIIGGLFAAAFNFINDRANWRAIIGLANTIMTSKNDVIGCEETIAVLDAHFYSERKIA